MRKALVTFDIENLYRVKNNVARVTTLLTHLGIKGTLFVTSDILENETNDIYDAQAQGHEIASHGSNHPYIYQRNFQYNINALFVEQNIRDYVKHSYNIFRDKGLKVKGFRSIGFRAGSNLLEETKKYFRYFAGNGNEIQRIDGSFIVLPISKILGNICFRPAMILYIPLNIIGKLLIAKNEIIVLYFHSFDIIKKPSELALYCSYWKKLIYYQKTGNYLEKRIEGLLYFLESRGFEFITCNDLTRLLLKI